MANQMQHSNRRGPPDDSWDKYAPGAGEGPPRANVRTSRDQILRDVSEDWETLKNLDYDDFTEDLRNTYDTVVKKFLQGQLSLLITARGPLGGARHPRTSSKVLRGAL